MLSSKLVKVSELVGKAVQLAVFVALHLESRGVLELLVFFVVAVFEAHSFLLEVGVDVRIAWISSARQLVKRFESSLEER